MNSDFMKTRPIFPLLLSMSLPMVISMLVNSLYNIIDSFFVAKISEDAMTSLSLVFPVQNFISATAIGFGIGINACKNIFSGNSAYGITHSPSFVFISISTVQSLCSSFIFTYFQSQRRLKAESIGKRLWSLVFIVAQM